MEKKAVAAHRTKKDGNLIRIPTFTTDEAPGVTFGGFKASPYLMTDAQKIPLREQALPDAMIACADKGPGWHLTTAFEWASMAHLWQQAAKPDDLIIDLGANLPQWIMGLFMHPNGTAEVLASTDVSYAGSPYGRGRVVPPPDGNDETAIIVCDGQAGSWKKRWRPGEFNGLSVYVAEANGLFPVVASGLKSLVIRAGGANLPATATFCILKHVDINITAGMESGNFIIGLSKDPDLVPFAIPASLGEHAAPLFGYDRFYFYKTTKGLLAALRGGYFGLTATAGVFYLTLYSAPSNSSYHIGFRACKASKI